MSIVTWIAAAALGALLALLVLAWAGRQLRALQDRWLEAVDAQDLRIAQVRTEAQAAALRHVLGTPEAHANPHPPGSADWVLWETAFQGELLNLRATSSGLA